MCFMIGNLVTESYKLIITYKIKILTIVYINFIKTIIQMQYIRSKYYLFLMNDANREGELFKIKA